MNRQEILRQEIDQFAQDKLSDGLIIMPQVYNYYVYIVIYSLTMPVYMLHG